MKHVMMATIIGSLVAGAACGDIVKAQGFGGGRGGRGGPIPYLPPPGQHQQQDVRAVMSVAEILSEAVALTVFDRPRVQMNLREAQRQLQALLPQLRVGPVVRQELNQALMTLRQPRLILERQAVEALRSVGRALNQLIVQTGNPRQDIRQLSRLISVLTEGSVFDVVANAAQNLGYAIQNARQVDRFAKHRMLQAVDQIGEVALNPRVSKQEKIRVIERSLDVIGSHI